MILFLNKFKIVNKPYIEIILLDNFVYFNICIFFEKSIFNII